MARLTLPGARGASGGRGAGRRRRHGVRPDAARAAAYFEAAAASGDAGAQSALAHEVSLGVERLRGEDAFVAFCEAAFSEKNWDKFTDKFTEKMTKGEMYDLYVDVAREAMTGAMGADAAASTAGEVRKLLELDAEALARGEKNPGNAMTQQLKFYVKLGRQTGVHVSPSAYVNGLFADTSSGWSESEWHAFFDAARGK